LPTPAERPNKADGQHRRDDDELAEDSSDEATSVVAVLDEDLDERGGRVLGLVEPLLVLREHALEAALAHVRDPAHRGLLHDEELEAHERAVGGRREEDRGAVPVDRRAVLGADADLVHDAGEQVREDGRHRAGREAEEEAEADEELALDRGVDVHHQPPEADLRAERALGGGGGGLDNDLSGDRLLLVAAAGAGLARRRGLDVKAVGARSGRALWHELEAEAAAGHAERLRGRRRHVEAEAAARGLREPGLLLVVRERLDRDEARLRRARREVVDGVEHPVVERQAVVPARVEAEARDAARGLDEERVERGGRVGVEVADGEAAERALAVGHVAERRGRVRLEVVAEALLDKAAVLEHVQEVVVLDLREVVRDHDRRHVAAVALDPLEDEHTRGRVERRRGLI
jgi:hypothetical protein